MGAALARYLTKQGRNTADSVFVSFLKEIDAVLTILINWIIAITPFAVFSLISRYVVSSLQFEVYGCIPGQYFSLHDNNTFNFAVL